MATRIQIRRGTAAEWTAANPVLASGEPAYETDTGEEKIGDGSSEWVDLPYKGLLPPVESGSRLLTLAYDPDGLLVGAFTRDANDAITSAPAVWPDGATGVFTATTLSTAFPGAIDAYTITHVAASGTTTYTQPLMTRSAGGAVTNRPAITVS